MNYKILIFFLLFSCTTYQTENIKKEINFTKTFSNAGFALIYNESLKKNKIVTKEIDNRTLVVFQKNLSKNTMVKITNLVNNKSLIAKVGSKAKYPGFYNAVISKRIAELIELDIDEPYIQIKEIDEKSMFVAGKAKTFDEEKKVADKAPVEGVTINTIGISNDAKENKTSKSKNFKYIIKIADFYFLNTAKSLNNRIKDELKIKKVNIIELSKTQYRLYLGPYENIISLKKAFNVVSKLEFENIEIIKQ